jgi:hypothetical protein
MTTTSAAAAAPAVSRTSAPDAPPRTTALIHAARLLLPTLERGHAIDAAVASRRDGARRRHLRL